MNKILILGHGESDLSSLILQTCKANRYDFEAHETIDFEAYDAYAFLGGNCGEAFIMPPTLRVKFEELRKTGKPIFAEFIRSVGYHGSGNVLKMDHQRLLYREQPIRIEDLSVGDILTHILTKMKLTPTRVFRLYGFSMIIHSFPPCACAISISHVFRRNIIGNV